MQVPIVPLVIATALFMENTDSTILATALPVIAHDLGLDPISLKLAVTSYLVSLAIFIPASGWVADRVGACTTFRLALVVFMAASIGCASSRSLAEFVMWRALQGAGGAMMVPVGRMTMVRTFPKSELIVAMSMTLISCGIPGAGLMRYLPPQIVGVWYHAGNVPEHGRMMDALQLPDWLFPKFESAGARDRSLEPVVQNYFERVPGVGDSFADRFMAVPWRGWPS